MSNIYGQNFEVGDLVVDLTAEAIGWPDQRGVILAVDGSNIEVKYTSGVVRWKACWNLRRVDASKDRPVVS